MSAVLKTLSPVIRQFPNGDYAVFNLPETSLWNAVFTGDRAKHEAFWALVKYYETTGLTRYQAYMKAQEATS